MELSFATLEELNAELKPKIEETKNLHELDGLYNAEDIKVYIDMYRKSIVKHQGSDFTSGRVNPNQIANGVNSYFGKVFEITRVDEFDAYPTVWLKEVK
jgi:hypothetical protein